MCRAPCQDAHSTETIARRWVAEAQLHFSLLPNTSIPTAVLLPCTLFTGQLRAGVVTDFDVRRVVLGSDSNIE